MVGRALEVCRRTALDPSRAPKIPQNIFWESCSVTQEKKKLTTSATPREPSKPSAISRSPPPLSCARPSIAFRCVAAPCARSATRTHGFDAVAYARRASRASLRTVNAKDSSDLGCETALGFRVSGGRRVQGGAARSICRAHARLGRGRSRAARAPTPLCARI